MNDRGPRHPWLALALLGPAPTLGTWAAFGWWPGAVGTGVYIACKLWVVSLPAWWSRWVDRVPWAWSTPRRGGFALGAALGLAMGGAVIGAYVAFGSVVIDPTAMRSMAAASGLDRPAVYLGGALWWITVNSVLEEYVFRWFIYRQCAARLPRGVAVLAAALAFTVHHTVALQCQSGWGLALLGSIGVFIGGAAWSWLYARTESVWPGYVSHAIVDAAIFGVGAVILFA